MGASRALSGRSFRPPNAARLEFTHDGIKEIARIAAKAKTAASQEFAAEAAARRVPLKRQGPRQFTDTCRVAGSPAALGAVTS